jgi:hypothetical protein
MPSRDLPRLSAAFNADGYNVTSRAIPTNPANPALDKVGIRAEHRSSFVDGEPLKPKTVYYLEGTHYEMGFLLGLLAEPTVARMTTDFVHRMIWDLIVWHPRQSTDPDPNDAHIVNRIKNLVGGGLADQMTDGCRAMERDLRQTEYGDELRGIHEGCLAANPATRVTLDDLLVLNFGIDWFMANVYTGFGLFEGLAQAIRDGLAGIELPGACNGFALFNGAAADNGHLFGRDFMFPTGGVFEHTACLIIYKPDPVDGQARHPFVSLTAPGLVGSIAGMNDKCVAIGVEIAPAAAADPARPGFNSLLLNRHCIETGGSAAAAADAIVQARRGVPWIYIIADGSSDTACVVEAVRYYEQDIDFLAFPPKSLKSRFLCHRPYLPGRPFLRDHPTARQQNGVMIRWAGYVYDQAYLGFNKRLFRRFGRVLYPGAHEPKGFINGTFSEKNCPYSYYFAPQREMATNIVLTTNHFVIPEMRYTAMIPWLALLFGKLAQDSQWRYDALNALIQDKLHAAGQAGQTGIDYFEAKEILQFLDPAGTYGGYYGTGKKVIEGAQSLFDLKQGTIESHYGFYRDDWIKLKLGDYI